ncbi:peroxisomal and mitochondrial division factor 2-like [Apium graveolens]|uniref:peroxisomal and mitochondrial division factor 2-like n=1 Tax=Apium graveolens TaxID=4045 RepID=UPI003D7B1CE0
MSDSTIVNGVVSEDKNVEIEDNSGDGNDSKVAALMQKIAALEQEKSELVHENEVVKERVNKLKEEIEESDVENEKLKSETKVLDSIAGRAAQLETEVSRLQHDLISSVHENQEINEELSVTKREIEELRKSEVSKTVTLEAIERERNLLLEKISNDSEGVKESNSRIRDLEKKIEALEMRDSGYKSEKVKAEEEMKEKIEERDLKIRTLQSSVDDLEAVLERSNKEREELEIVKNELEALLKKSERKVKEMEGKMGLLHKELEGSEKMISGLKEKAADGMNGDNVVIDRGIVGDDKKGLLGFNLEWPLMAASAGAIVLCSVVYLYHVRQR